VFKKDWKNGEWRIWRINAEFAKKNDGLLETIFLWKVQISVPHPPSSIFSRIAKKPENTTKERA